MIRKRPIIFVVFILLLTSGLPATAKKIKNSFTIGKNKPTELYQKNRIDGKEFIIGDSISENLSEERAIAISLMECSFAGYDKEINSNKESFILINKSDREIKGYKVRIDYLDMQGRMLHSRIVEKSCEVPPNESRRFDIKSWDGQHTYYYYLGNEPKKVATPFQVVFHPQSFWVTD